MISIVSKRFTQVSSQWTFLFVMISAWALRIAEHARSQTFAGCQFLTVEALATSEYSAVGFYQRCGFTANEVRKPYKDTLRMFRTLYANEEEYVGE